MAEDVSDVLVVGHGSEPFEAIQVRRRLYDSEKRPDLRFVDETTLRNGPQAYRVARHYEVLDRNTGEVHHHSVVIETLKYTRNAWTVQPEHRVTITDKGDDEIERLRTFLGLVKHGMPVENETFMVVPVGGWNTKATAKELLELVTTEEKASVLVDTLKEAEWDPTILKGLIETARSDPNGARAAAAMINVARFTAALDELRLLVESDDVLESAFQDHLEMHPWIFGSEYSARLERRRWTRDEQADIMLRRTTDGYMELIELKTPLAGADLFVYDRSHRTYAPSSKLSGVIGQVMHYLEQLDADRHGIRARDGEDAFHTRARIVVGRNGDASQTAALRRLNGHLNRIEVITFDQLLSLGQSVVDQVRRVVDLDPELVAPSWASDPNGDLGDVPF